MSTPAALSAAVLLLAACIFFTMVYELWPYTLDDSFITFRYAQNWVAGFGPTWNPGMKPIEGYTSFLWLLLMTVPHYFGLDAVVASKVLGVAAMLGSMLIAFLFVKRLVGFDEERDPFFSAAVAALLIGCFPATVVHAVSGMETALATFMMTTFFYLITTLCIYPTKTNTILASLAGLLIGLTRPESNLPAVVGLLSTVIILPRDRRRLLVWAALFCYILPGAGYFLWRVTYYGHLFPLPFYIKVVSQGSLPGLRSTANFTLHMLGYFGLLFILGTLRLNRAVAPALLSAVALLVFLVFPSHIMGQDWRYFFPVVPLIAVISALGIGNLQRWIRGQWNMCQLSHRAYYVVVLAAICATIPAGFWENWRAVSQEKEALAHSTEAGYIALGKKLAAFPSNRANDRVIALVDAGAIPYYSKWRTIDTFGLNDPHIALSNQRNPGYILSFRPDLVVLVSRERDTFQARHSHETALYTACRQAGMQRLNTVQSGPISYLWIMGYPSTPVGRYILDAGA